MSTSRVILLVCSLSVAGLWLAASPTLAQPASDDGAAPSAPSDEQTTVQATTPGAPDEAASAQADAASGDAATGAANADEVAADEVPAELTVEEPAAVEPTPAPEPVVTEPVVTEPVVTEPVVTEPVVTEPVVTEPVVTEPTPAAEPTHDESIADEALEEPTEEAATPPDFTGSLHGEYRYRLAFMSDLPLTPFESKGFVPELGQNMWGSQWLRVGFDVAYQHRLSLEVEASALDGMVFGDETNGVTAADRPRDGVTATRSDAFDLRKAYVQYITSFAAFRVGLQPSHWGLGILAHAGDEAPVFGDYVEGDRDLRVLAATRPLGMSVPFEIITAADMVYDDSTARLRDGDHAYQGILAVRYRSAEEGVHREAGFYGVYRHQTSPVDGGALAANVPDDTLDVWALDLFANWDFEEPSGGRVFAAFEAAAVFGDTSLTRTIERDKEDVRQFLGALQVGRRGESLDITIEGGYSSGDSNTEDGVQRRGTMSRNHRVGLLLFPEVMAWNTARAASLASSEELGARPSPGSQLLPTDGGVAGAFYLFPHVSYRPTSWVDLRAGVVWGRASSAVVDPYRQRAESRTTNYQGGDPKQRDLGVELDGSVLLSYNLPEDVVLTGGIEGAWLRPGRAFDDASGAAMSNVGLLRLRIGLSF